MVSGFAKACHAIWLGLTISLVGKLSAWHWHFGVSPPAVEDSYVDEKSGQEAGERSERGLLRERNHGNGYQ